jgi:hypothetical protein
MAVDGQRWGNVCLHVLAACADAIAGKPRSNREMRFLLEPGLPAKNDNAVCLLNQRCPVRGQASHRCHSRLGLVQSRGTGFSREEIGTSTAYPSPDTQPSRLKPVPQVRGVGEDLQARSRSPPGSYRDLTEDAQGVLLHGLNPDATAWTDA